MLSRLGFRNACAQIKSISARGAQTSALVCPADDPRRMKRPESHPPVRLGFIPETWFTFFYPKTGVTGPYMFLFSVSTYLVSKEWFVLEHEFYNGLSLLSIIMFVHIKYGAKIGAALDKKVAEYDAELEQTRIDELTELEKSVKELEKQKWMADAQFLIYDIKKQNILVQLEAAYRERLAKVYSEVKKRLDYQAQVEAVERRIAQRHMVQWITNSVLKAITPELEKANLAQCISDLEALAAAKA
ncbi:ATP synthase subunit b, mitochondrial [Megachile rotundata]|uniref:ATP synthase subunit b, mitochondrial n=1 Tax=Megachile rotundata TaxID=143995 RepID=UPI000258F333|nr:PREDICTED: ATP synthase subunit b, mitochondrial [Megachile rotundata]